MPTRFDQLIPEDVSFRGRQHPLAELLTREGLKDVVLQSRWDALAHHHVLSVRASVPIGLNLTFSGHEDPGHIIDSVVHAVRSGVREVGEKVTRKVEEAGVPGLSVIDQILADDWEDD